MADDTLWRRAASGRVPSTYRIFLRDFTAVARLGEPPLPRPVRIDVELAVAHPGSGFPDDITAVMSYEGIVEGLRRLCAEDVFGRVDALAGQAAELCLTDPRVQRVRLDAQAPWPQPDDPVTGATVSRSRPPQA